MLTTSVKHFAPFERSAAYYDLIYASKDYAGEAAVVAHHLRLPSDDKAAMLRVAEFGCGTGNFMLALAKHNLSVLGVEPSKAMRTIAEDKGLYVIDGTLMTDVCDEIDAACSLFGAFSYGTAKHSDLMDALVTIHYQLRKGGRFVFDCVNVAAAAAKLTEYSSQSWTLPQGELRREMRKTFSVHDSIVTCELAYRAGIDEWQETHFMRAFTPSEITFALNEAGFNTLAIFNPESQGEDDGKPGVGSYYFMVVAEAR